MGAMRTNVRADASAAVTGPAPESGWPGESTSRIASDPISRFR